MGRLNLAEYLKRRQSFQNNQPRFRQPCWTCRQPDFSCYCEWLKPFDPIIQFVILIHPIEYHRRIATGRMSHLILKNSMLIQGSTFAEDSEVGNIARDPDNQCLILYPGRNSSNLSLMGTDERSALFLTEKNNVIFVIDGTWGTAKKMVNQSPDLKALPRISFTPPGPSNFHLRKQPRPECYSTIEAIHHTIDLLGPVFGFHGPERPHDNLLFAFENMVRRQLDLAHGAETETWTRRRSS